MKICKKLYVGAAQLRQKSQKYQNSLNEVLQSRNDGQHSKTFRLPVDLQDLDEEAQEPMMGKFIQRPAAFLPFYEQALHAWCQGESKFGHLDEIHSQLELGESTMTIVVEKEALCVSPCVCHTFDALLDLQNSLQIVNKGRENGVRYASQNLLFHHPCSSRYENHIAVPIV